MDWTDRLILYGIFAVMALAVMSMVGCASDRHLSPAGADPYQDVPWHIRETPGYPVPLMQEGF